MSSDKSEEEEHEIISRQIVDYYRKYSQTKHLPKYFAGTSLSYMPPIVKEDDVEAKSQPAIVVHPTTDEVFEEKHEGAEPKAVSPTSSITSNKKLEWDNGADIGYNNCNKRLNLHKSASLPILFVDMKNPPQKPSGTKLSSQIITVISYPNEDKRIESSSSSSYPEQVPIESSSSSLKTNKKPTSTSSSSYSSSLAYLKSKIGSPDAESTPRVDVQMYTETPLTKTEKRLVNLCLTKPITVQCSTRQKKTGDKKIQTSIVQALTKSVQTSESVEVLAEESKNFDKKPKENQSVIIINYDSENEKKTCSSNTQTDDMVASECNSFEYHKYVRENSKKSDLVLSRSSNDTPLLGQLIAQKQSQSLVGDIDRSIEILQKLLKSKKYDGATKKRYIKKIVEKIVDTKYNEDSTTSSELFIPKKPDSKPKLSVKTFSDEFLPTNIQCESQKNPFYHNNVQNESKKKSIFTTDKAEPSSGLDTEASLIKQNSSSGSYHSWKDDKTDSEKLIEKQKGQGDQLVKFAMKERQHQIAWINDEISHLTKLKGLLEKKIQTTTTVYMVSQHLDVSSGSSCSCPDSRNRNYVIRTETSSGSDRPVQYKLNKSGSYCVTNLTKPEMNVNRQVVGDIKVVSDEKTTNIDVKTKTVGEDHRFPKAPTLVGTGKYETFPRSKTEEEKHRKADGPTIKKYSFDLPITSQTNLAEKINHIVTKYTSNRRQQCECLCKCPPRIGTSSTPKCTCCKCLDRKVTNMNLPKTIDSGLLCPCCVRKNSAQSGMNRCDCSDKEVQTSIYERDFNRNYKNVCDCSDKEIQARFSDKESRDDQISCDVDCECSDKEIQARMYSKESSGSRLSSSESSSISSTTETSPESMKSCICCKKKNVTSKRLFALRKKLSDQAHPLCRPCYRQNRRGCYPPGIYANPTHVCNCYTVVETKTLNEIKKTINDLNVLDEFCTCANTSRDDKEYCKSCRCKLKKTSRNRNGIAYMLTFENGSFKEDDKKKHKKRYLEEIKIKIPVAYKKKYKEKENKRKKKKRESEESSSGESRRNGRATLQDHLMMNRPDFVETAEGRRKTVNESKNQREEMSDYNKLLFLQKCQEECEKNSKRIFTPREMKEITRRNYKKLPEVQRKLNENKDKQLRQASRLMADVFNKKLRENVLRGKRDLPTNVNVIKM